MDSQARRDWLEDEVTREVVEELKKNAEQATRSVIVGSETGDLADIRSKAGYARGLKRALRIVIGGKTRDGEDEA